MSSDAAAGGRRRCRRLILLFVVSYALFLVVLVPAERVLTTVAADASVRPQQLSGSLWRGELWGGDRFFGLRQLRWQWRPAALLRGQAGYRIALGDATLTADLGLSGSGSLRISDLAVDGRLSELLQSLAGLPLLSDVQVEGQVADAEFSIAGCQQLEGAALRLSRWSGLMAESLNRLGILQIYLSCGDSALNGQLQAQPQGGTLGGTFRLAPNGSYQLRLEGQPQDDALRDQLAGLGFRQQGGRWVLVRQGRL